MARKPKVKDIVEVVFGSEDGDGTFSENGAVMGLDKESGLYTVRTISVEGMCRTTHGVDAAAIKPLSETSPRNRPSGGILDYLAVAKQAMATGGPIPAGLIADFRQKSRDAMTASLDEIMRSEPPSMAKKPKR